ncbi:uncharacterized protein LOC133198829 [Saccostrea echinata]|uniref:uncharacterized protein LOC133198829 n=1 Tax=Saccostrea echinata TaxID=191078 RepID=UPI002A841C04|nr:uncharacterized protein LOC133198829 [Saccostrea echinata]
MASSKTRYYCAAEGCHADTRKMGRYGYMAEVKFFPFPTQKKDPKCRRAWLSLLRRKDYDPPMHHRVKWNNSLSLYYFALFAKYSCLSTKNIIFFNVWVCSRHFVDGSPTPENPYPTLFAYNNFKEPLQDRSSTSITKRSAAEKPNEFLENSQLMESNEEAANVQSYNDSHSQCYMEMECVDFQTPPVVSEETVASVCETLNTVVQPCHPDHEYASAAVGDSHGPDTVDCGIQTDFGMEEMVELMALKKKFENPDALMRNLFIEKVTATDRSVKQYTGIPSKSMLHGLYEVLDEASPNIKYWSGQSSAEETPYQQNADRRKTGPTRKLSKYEEFIMTLIRLRLAIFTFFFG